MSAGESSASAHDRLKFLGMRVDPIVALREE